MRYINDKVTIEFTKTCLIYFVEPEGKILITEFKSEGNLTEGSVVTFTCSAELLGNVGIIPVTWKLNDAVIDPISTSRWKPVFIPMDPDFPRKRRYQLIINPILTIDSGKYCYA